MSRTAFIGWNARLFQRHRYTLTDKGIEIATALLETAHQKQHNRGERAWHPRPQNY